MNDTENHPSDNSAHTQSVKLGKRSRNNVISLPVVRLSSHTLLYSICTYDNYLTFHITNNITTNHNNQSTNVLQPSIRAMNPLLPIQYHTTTTASTSSSDMMDDSIDLHNDSNTVDITPDQLLGTLPYVTLSLNSHATHNTMKQYLRTNKQQYRLVEYQNTDPLQLLSIHINTAGYNHQIRPVNINIQSPSIIPSVSLSKRLLSQPLPNHTTYKPAVSNTYTLPACVREQLLSDDTLDGYCVVNDMNDILSICVRRNVACEFNLLDDDKQDNWSQQLLSDMFGNKL